MSKKKFFDGQNKKWVKAFWLTVLSLVLALFFPPILLVSIGGFYYLIKNRNTESTEDQTASPHNHDDSEIGQDETEKINPELRRPKAFRLLLGFGLGLIGFGVIISSFEPETKKEMVENKPKIPEKIVIGGKTMAQLRETHEQSGDLKNPPIEEFSHVFGLKKIHIEENLKALGDMVYCKRPAGGGYYFAMATQDRTVNHDAKYSKSARAEGLKEVSFVYLQHDISHEESRRHEIEVYGSPQQTLNANGFDPMSKTGFMMFVNPKNSSENLYFAGDFSGSNNTWEIDQLNEITEFGDGRWFIAAEIDKIEGTLTIPRTDWIGGRDLTNYDNLNRYKIPSASENLPCEKINDEAKRASVVGDWYSASSKAATKHFKKTKSRWDELESKRKF